MTSDSTVSALRNESRRDGLGQPEITDDQFDQAITVLKSRRDHYIQRASSGVENRTETEKGLTAMRVKLVTDRENYLSMLVVDALSEAEIKTLLAKIKELFSGGIRAVAGEDFTNSVGIEMVWVPEGGFWIGRTSDRMKFIRGFRFPRVYRGSKATTDLKIQSHLRSC